MRQWKTGSRSVPVFRGPIHHAPGPRPGLQVAPDVALGAIEKRYQMVERSPGLSDPVAAYATGRALRMIRFILDERGSPPEHDPAFLSRLAEAPPYSAIRGERQPWGCGGHRLRLLGDIRGACAVRGSRARQKGCC